MWRWINICWQRLWIIGFHNFWAFQSGGKWLTMYVAKSWTTMMNCRSSSRQLMVILEFKLWKNYGILTLEMTTTKKDNNVFKTYTMEQKWIAHALVSSQKFRFVSLCVVFNFLLQVMGKCLLGVWCVKACGLGRVGSTNLLWTLFYYNAKKMAKTQAIQTKKIHGKFQDAKLGCDKLYWKN